MKVITYRVTLLEPVLVTSLQGDPNSAVAFDYLPGSVLRGVWINKHLNSKLADIGESTLRRLFFDGTTRYLNGYPLDAYNQPCLPVPLSWQQAKGGKEDVIFDFAVEAPEDEEEQWQAVRKPFYRRSGEEVRLLRPARNLAVHTQRTARFGRAMQKYRPAENPQAGQKVMELLTEDEILGAVYHYDALAAGQAFQAAIICDDADVSRLRPLLEGRVSLGGSRSGGYGQAEISHVQEHEHEPEWDAPGAGEHAPPGKLIVTLRSDILLRDTRGQFAVDPDLFRQVLSKHLQVPLTPEKAFLDTQLIGGFNRRWGLPLPQALAARMGSVLIFHDPGCDAAKLAALEKRGIGERREEGFGRLVFNRQRVAELSVDTTTPPAREPAITISEEPASKLAAHMVTRMFKQRLDERVLAVANSTTIVNPPSNAQISRLRGVVLEELYSAQPGTSTICQFIQSIEERSSARRQFERSTIKRGAFEEVSFLRWLKDQLKCDHKGAWTMDDHAWRSLLNLSEDEANIQIGGVKASINDSLRLEYVLRLVDLVLANAARERGKEN
jgi:CRISPR-associated protein Csx10